jgi:hypothetical protein
MNEPYVKINAILAALLVGIFAYSFFSPSLSRGGMTVPSSCEGMPAAYCKSRGLTRAFAALTRGQTDEARTLNRYSVSVFVFFAAQLAARIGFSIFFIRRSTSAIVYADIILSTTYFLLIFIPLVVPG